jgi:hypothetical protein
MGLASDEETQKLCEEALGLLLGEYKNGRLVTLSGKSEAQGLAALCGALVSMSYDYPHGDKRHALLINLAAFFAPPTPNNKLRRMMVGINGVTHFKPVFRRATTGPTDHLRDFIVAVGVHVLRKRGMSYEAAAAKVARIHKYKDTRHVKEIYSRYQKRLARVSGKLADDMAELAGLAEDMASDR